MSVTMPSDPREIQEFQFKLICRLQVFDQKDGENQGSYNLVTTASKYGLLFVGSGKLLQAILLPHVLEMENPTDHKSPRGASHGGTEIRNYPRRELLLPDMVTNIQVNCDQSLLAVAVAKGGCAHALIYDVASFHGKTINLVKEVRLATSPDTHLLELSWNPGIANILACCLSNGTVTLYEFKNGGVDINTLPPEAQATCFSWSPKGKQLVVGSLNGYLTQYKPDLKAVKNISPPAIFENPASVVNVLWISNYQFAAVYRDSINDSERPSLLIVNAPKTGGFTFVNYEDICYSSGDLRKPQFYLLHQQNWNVLVVGSANSMEVGVLGLTNDGLTWEQWLQEDASRAELPLTSSKEETFPLGMGLDTSTQKQLPWGENHFLPPMPVLTLLSHRGVLCLFYVINTLPNATVVCTPPEKLPDENMLVHFATSAASNEQSSLLQKLDSSQQGIINTPQSTKSVEWSTPSGVVDMNRMGLRVNLTDRFENISPPLNQTVTKGFSFAPNEPPKLPGDSSTTDLSTSFQLNANPSSVPGTGSLFSGLGTQPQFGLSKPNENNSSVITLTTLGQGNATLNFPLPAATSTPNLQGVKPPQIQQQQQQGQSQRQELIPSNLHQPHYLPQQQHVPQPFFQAPPHQQQLPSQQAPQLAQILQLPPQPHPQLPQQVQQLMQQRPMPQKPIQQTESSASASKQLPNLFGNLGNIKALSNVDSSLTGKTETKTVSSTAAAVPTVPTAATTAATAGTTAPAAASAGDGSGGSEGAKQTIINSEVLYLAIQEEMNHFENEMAELKTSLAKLSVEVGTPEEKTQLRMKVDAMNNFCQELQEATNALCSEVRALKAEMVESLAWAEDARSRAAQQNDPCWLQVVRSQELDPVSARYLANVKQLSYYVETQLCQADRSLELQWANFQESCRDKIKGRLYIPSLEAVYQAMVLQSNILLKQKANVKHIMERTAKHKLTKGDSISVLKSSITNVQSKSDTDLAALAENLLQMRLGASGAGGVGEDISEIMAAGRYSMVASMNRKLTPEKQTILREFLTQGPVRHIRPAKPLSNALKNLTSLDKHSKSVDVKSSISVSEISPLGHLDKMVARMGSENVNGLKTSLLSSVPQRNVGISPKENQRAVSTDSQNPGDLFGHIAKSVVTKFKEPDLTLSDKVQSTSESEESTKILENQLNQLDNSVGAFNISGAGKQTLSFSFSSSLPPSSGPPLTKSKVMSNFNFSLSPNQSTSQLGEGFPKNNSASSFSFQVPSTTVTGTTTTSASSIFSGTTNKPSSFSFFPSNTASVTSAPVQFFGNTESLPAKEFDHATTPKTFSFGSLSVNTTTTPTSTSMSSVFSDKTTLGQTAVAGGASQTAKVTQAPPILGNLSLSNSGSDFSFSVPTTSVPNQSTPNNVKSIFGGVQNKSVSETAIPDSSSQSITSKSSMPTMNLFGSTNSLSNTGPVAAANTQVSSKPASVFSSGMKSAQGTGDFCLGQLDAALSLTSSNKDGTEKLEQLPISTSISDTSTPSAIVTSASTKPFAFSLSNVSTPASVMGTKAADENDKNKPLNTAASVSFFGQPVCSPSSFSQNATNIFGQKTPSSIFGGGGNSVVSSSNEDKPSASSVPVASSEISLGDATSPTAEITTAVAASTTSPVTSTSLFSGSALVSSLPSPGAAESTDNPTTTAVTTSTTPSLFANSASSTPLFGNTSTVPTSDFGAATTVSSPAFGSGSNFFGQTSTTSSSSIFKPQGTATITPVFGQATTTSATGSIFGQTATSTTSIFGQAAAAAAAATTTSSMFSQPSTATTSVFGQAPTSTTASVFGQQPSTTSSSSIFGQPTTSTVSVFGQPASTTATSLFGQQASTTASVFGQPASAAATTSTSVFGSGSSATSMFGQPANTASTNVFGQPSTTPSPAFGGSNAVFGQTPGPFMGGATQPAFGSNPTFGQSGGSLFGQNTGTSFGTSGGSIFGGGSTFGKTGNLFQSSTGGSIFGGGSGAAVSSSGAFSAPQGQSIAESGFGSPTAFGQQNKAGAFGSPPAFGQTSGGSGFGGSPTFGGAPTFGGSPVFGSPNRVFGGPPSPSSGGMFGGGNTPQQSNTFENLANQNTMTFGNLASGQSPTFGTSGGSLFGGAGTSQPQAPAFQNTPSFGGSSFSSWR